MVDFIPNHTSDQHKWFKESSSSRNNPRHDWYIWADADKNGNPPCNWASVFSLPQLERRKKGDLIIPEGELTPPATGWQWHEGRQQFYLHSFAVEQPDLNWSNPEVQKAMQGNLRFWLNRGVDGFRIDVANHIGKNMDFLDEPFNPDYVEGIENPYDQLQNINSANYKTMEYYLQKLLDVLQEPNFKARDLYMVFEVYATQDVLNRVNNISPIYSGAFNFSRMRAPWDAETHRYLIENYFKHLPTLSIPNHVSGNHDNTRIASRIGLYAARATAVIDACLPGQMYIYNGEEAGLMDVDIPYELRDDKYGLRDSARTPMPWDNSINAGFSRAQNTWLPLDPKYSLANIAMQAMEKDSTLSHYKRLLKIRRTIPVLTEGSYQGLQTSDDNNVFAFARISEKQKLVVLTNFADTDTSFKIKNSPIKSVKPILSSSQRALPKITDLNKPITLKPYESVILVSPSTYWSMQVRDQIKRPKI